MSTTRNELPDNLNPDGDVCVPIVVPNDAEWLWLLHKAIGLPSQQRFWIKDPENNRDTMRHNWESRVAQPFAQSIIDGVICLDDSSVGSLGECFRLNTTTEAFAFYPNDPFTDSQNDNGNAIATSLKWQRWGAAGVNGIPYAGDIIESVLGFATGYFENDIFITLDTLSLFDNPIDRLADIFSGFTSFPFPTVDIELEGEGQLEIELVNVPFGGSALLIPDSPLNIQDMLDLIVEYLDGDEELPSAWVLAELNRDLFSFPPELVATNVIEFEFSGDTTHTMKIIFIPRLDIEPPFYFPFGGIREIEACGSLRIIGSQTGEEITKSNHGLERHIREGLIGMATYEDLRKAVHHGTIDAWKYGVVGTGNGLGANIAQGIEIGTDGTITLKSGNATGGKTIIDTSSQEQANAGYYAQAENIQGIFDNVAVMKANGFSSANIANLALAERNILNFAEWTTKLIAYADGSLAVSIDVLKLAEYIFCNGFDNGIVQYVINEHTEVEADIITFVVNNVTDEILNVWYQQGASGIRDDYLEYDCVPPPDETFIITPDNYGTLIDPQWQQNIVRPAGYRWLFQFSGALTRISDGVKISGLYIDGAKSNVVVLRNTASSTSVPFDNYPNYNPEHEYNAILTAPNSAFEYVGRFTGFPSVANPVTALEGAITVRKVYLGLD